MIIHGDCLEEIKNLQDESIDAIVTDPPYCGGWINESSLFRNKWPEWFDGDDLTPASLVWLLRSLAVEGNRILRSGGFLCMFTDWRMYPYLVDALGTTGLTVRGMVVWAKNYIGPGVGFRSQHELVIVLSKGKAKYFDKKIGNVITCPRVKPNAKYHPTEKPVELMDKIIRVVTPPNGKVLDTFCGSGSTLVAAKRGGYSYVGIERDERFVNIAKMRLEQEDGIAL